ncbi:MFS transporter [Isobaculum melis]|uniref:MFS transporter, DHA2 family, multidrug resistance protein n=1 Tax=Isobaculum melis TaxID=142588 RepID=A0A1H9TC81_9LACT|nr:MFS transporter [Isobaculum melis]SER94771.1 MFS transporter, DHA2 family, multidrug resistance protein [Isobaculum melis]
MKTTANTADAVAYKGTNKLLIGIVLSVLTYWLFAQSLLNMAPSVQADLGVSSGILNIGISMTGLFSGIFIVVAGGLADKVGRMKLTYIGLILSIIGSAALVIANGSFLFIAGRILQGLSAACIMPATMALVKTYYDGKDRQRALSYWSIGSWGGSGLCSFFGGAIASSLGWRYVFIFSILISLLSIFLIFGTPESKVESNQKSKFDTIGLLLFIVSMVALNIVVSKGSELGWTSPMVLGLAVIVVVGLIVFYKVERAIDDSFVEFSLFENRGYLGATISNFLLNAVAGTLIVINTYVQQGRGLSAASTGLLSIGYLCLVLVTIRIGEKLLQTIGAKKPMLWGTISSGVGIGLMALTTVTGTAYFVLVFIGYSLFGMGLGMYATPSTDTAISSVPNEKAGVASGIYKMASSLGGSLGVAISAAVYNGFSAGVDYTLGATLGLLTNVVFCLLALLSIVFIIPAEKRN